MFDDSDLELAFQLHVLDRVVGADLATTAAEQRFLDRCFPVEILRSRGLIDAHDQRTARFHEALAAAREQLPARLDDARKLRLLDDCYRLATADREIRIGEGVELLAASRALGLSDEAFDTFLAERPAATGLSAAFLDRDDT